MTQMSNESSFCAPISRQTGDDSFYLYQIKHLQNEIEYARLSYGLIWKVAEFKGTQFLSRHAQQFYWTVTRFLGLGHIHEGGRRKTRPRPVLMQERVELAPGPRILIDITETHRTDLKAGIQRVAREIAKASIASGGALPVIVEDGRLLSYFQHPDLPDVIEIEPTDQLLLLDGWGSPEEYSEVLQQVSRRGARCISCIHDLIPLLYPGVFSGRHHIEFSAWLAATLPYCHALVTVSNSVAEDFVNYAQANALPGATSLRVGWFHLGADFSAVSENGSAQVRLICEGKPFFTTVGTLEPRKNHGVVLAAFELLWKSGVDVRYVIVGKTGWLVDGLCHRLRHHREFGRRLIWLEDADDADVSCLYRHATALIQPSIAEGFGLPIIEAAHFGTPVIASNIRVFREIGGDSIRYFDPMKPDALAERIRAALVTPRVAPTITPLSWKEATARLLSLVKSEAYPYRVNEPPRG